MPQKLSQPSMKAEAPNIQVPSIDVPALQASIPSVGNVASNISALTSAGATMASGLGGLATTGV